MRTQTIHRVIIMDEPVCNRCGRCCHYEKNGRWKACKYLVIFGKLSSCRIWNDLNRIGREIDEGIYCNQMSALRHTYVGCPYNAGKPIVLVRLKRYDG